MNGLREGCLDLWKSAKKEVDVINFAIISSYGGIMIELGGHRLGIVFCTHHKTTTKCQDDWSDNLQKLSKNAKPTNLLSNAIALHKLSN